MKFNWELWRSRSIVLTALSIFLGSFFILMGILKLSPIISPEIHRELRRNFIHFAKLTPIWTTYFGWKIPARYYRIGWGTIESSAGFILIFIPFRRLKIIANIVLLLLTLFSILNHHSAGHRFDRIAPCIVFTLMLACRLVVEYQVQRRTNRAAFITSSVNGNHHPTIDNNHIDDDDQFDDNRIEQPINHAKVD
ncbi:DoxX-like [Dermatophagoides pteronyssinus]|uniref:Novel acetylcholine receptor chaperone n=2 Tax=Dermatophagoides pteronyssinus TaxID=6956 RepID=A0A6P6YJY2_DERPT|nr:transmembrane protein 35A-like [Dermatophagoides pteronyssinus]KAH9425305.1 DoxX-like [Dermatophagoides pteronyssinus]